MPHGMAAKNPEWNEITQKVIGCLTNIRMGVILVRTVEPGI